MSPDVFLSRNGIRYDGLIDNLGRSAAEIVANLKALNATRVWNSDFNRIDEIVYRPTGFTPAPFGPSAFDFSLIRAESAAIGKWYASLQTGDLDQIHNAIESVNAVRSQKGGSSIFAPGMSDFELLAHGNNPVGNAAKFIISERASILETGFPSMAGSPIPWFDTKAGFDALNAYGNV